MDDAGAGFASFRHILNLQPDVIKLDIGLTRGIDSDPARRALGRALLSFGMDAYNASIVAEGIETKDEFNTLKALGFSAGQGFYLGRPSRLPLQRPASAASFERPRPVEVPSVVQRRPAPRVHRLRPLEIPSLPLLGA